MMILFFIMSYSLGKHTEKNGYLAGIIFGFLNIFFFIILGVLFFREDLKLRLILYDL